MGGGTPGHAYDWDAAAAEALRNGFPRWAEALATGAVTAAN